MDMDKALEAEVCLKEINKLSSTLEELQSITNIYRIDFGYSTHNLYSLHNKDIIELVHTNTIQHIKEEIARYRKIIESL